VSWSVLVTRLFAVVMVAWPVAATAVVSLFRRSRIEHRGRFLLASILTGYALSLFVPVAILLAGFLIGWVAEVATLYAILLSPPVLVVVQLAAALLWAGRFGALVPPDAPTG